MNQRNGKYCKKCMRVKTASHFYVNRKRGNTLSPECKECTRARATRNRWANIDARREYDRQRHKKDERRRELLSRQCVKFRKESPVKYKAQTAVGNALRDGRLKRDSCEVCGATKVHAHHDDYAKPLEVRWLCAIHHAEWHTKNGPGKNGDADSDAA